MKDENYIKSMKGLDFEPVARIDKKGKKVKATVLPDQVVIMPKLNGVRMRWDVQAECLRTNNGNRVMSCDHIVEQIMDNKELRKWPLDGESYYHGPEYTFSTINGKTRRKQSTEETAFLQFHLFELATFGRDINKVARLEKLKEMSGSLNPSLYPSILRVPFAVLPSSSIDVCFQDHLYRGYEGVMISDPAALYTSGKGKWMYKYKPAYDREFAFVCFEYAKEGRNVGSFAAIRFRMDDGQEFTCSGISDDSKASLLARPPRVGDPCTVEYGDLSDTGVPIFPRFKDIRWDL